MEMNASMKLTPALAFSALLAFAASTAHAGKVKFTYDSADRMIAANYGAGKATTFSHDANGNLLNRTTQTATSAEVRFSASSATPATTAAGSLFNYSFTITNDGPHPATGVSFDDVLPFGIEPTSGTATQGAGFIEGCTVAIDLGVLGVGGTATVTISARHGFAGNFSNLATVAANEPDPIPANNTASVATTATTPQDSDGDGIPNWWEALNISSGAPFTDFGDFGAAGDFDADGVSNFNEFIADTAANDSSELFQITGQSLQGGSFSLSFMSSPLRLYTFERAELLTTPFLPVLQNIEGTGQELMVNDPDPPTDRGFYRVRATIPPPP